MNHAEPGHRIVRTGTITRGLSVSSVTRKRRTERKRRGGRGAVCVRVRQAESELSCL